MQHSTYSSSFVCWKNGLIIVRIPNWYSDAIYMFVEEKQNITEARLKSFFFKFMGWSDFLISFDTDKSEQNFGAVLNIHRVSRSMYNHTMTEFSFGNRNQSKQKFQLLHKFFYEKNNFLFFLIRSSVGVPKKKYQY